jgi:predicted ATPase/class 3 adenylate cyclase
VKGSGSDRVGEASVDIAAWLRGLGLEQYEAAFRANEIDPSVLPRLTAEDLKDLGVTLVGHRRRLLDAIAELGAEEPTSPDASAPAAVERRHLAMMFCDLVGSTELATRLDPEDLREVIAAYHRAVADMVRSCDGFVAKYMGDGVLVYFGYPRAHEDDAERAVRAGLGVVEAVSRLGIKAANLHARVGIATGLVVVGDLIGEGSAQEQSVVGETPNLAARLQTLAEPGAVVIDHQTRRQTAGLFEYEDLRQIELKGFAQRIQAWRVLRESNVVSRFEALRSAATPLVGREEELDLLLRRWRQAKEGEGRVVLISGEPGIGKSRLTEALHERLGSEKRIRLRYFCSPHHQDSALSPVIAQLERAAGFARDDAVEVKLNKLKTLLALGSPRTEDFALVAERLSLADPVLQAAIRDFSPQRKKEQTFETLLDQLRALARDLPVLIVFEDVHWIDPSSRELLDLWVDRVRELRVLLIVTSRPEFQPPWLGQPHITSVALNRLDRREGSALVQAVAGIAALPDEVVTEVFERADGVPLFVEELTKAVLEAADRDRGTAVLAATPSPALAVPATLNASLIARLDRLGSLGKEIAQIGAVLGREFPYELIQPVSGWPAAELNAALDRLTGSGLLLCRGAPPHAVYQFKHALVQDAAYGTLLRARRQEFHARTSAVLEERFRDIVEGQPELLAHHLTAAGETEWAIAQWLRAGTYAAARSAHVEAIRHFRRALALLSSLPETRDRDRQEIELQLARGLSLVTAEGFNSAEAAEAYSRARDLCERSGDADRLFVALWNLWVTTVLREIDTARLLSNKLLTLTRTQKDGALRLEAHHTAWFTRFYLGELAAARGHCDEGCRLYDFERHRSLALLYGGHDPGVCARYIGAWADWILGYPDKALAGINDAVGLAERLAHPLSLDLAYLYAAVLHLFRREPEIALQRTDAAEILASEQRLALMIEPNMLRSSASLAQGALKQAGASISEGLAARKKMGSYMFRAYDLALMAEVLERAGDHDGALAALADAVAIGEESGERWWEAEIHRLRGTFLLSRRLFAEGEACLQHSIRTAQRQQAKSLELRGAMSLARLWHGQGQHERAHNLLAPIYGWFTEGFDTLDLKEAKALLDELC